MSTPNDDLLLLVSLPVTGQWGTLEELWSRHNLEDVLDALLRRYQLGSAPAAGRVWGSRTSTWPSPAPAGRQPGS
jgi:hypothetical protein